MSRPAAAGSGPVKAIHRIALCLCLTAAAWIVPFAAASQQWTIPPDRLADIDLANPYIASAQDATLYRTAVADMNAASRLIGTDRSDQIPTHYWAWAMRRIAWWESEGRWLYGAHLDYAGAVVFAGRTVRGQARQLVLKAAADVAHYLSDHFGLPKPTCAVVVRIFDDWRRLPPAIAEPFARHEGMVSVSGLTIPPRFVVIPTLLPARHFWSRDERLVDPAGRIVSLLTFRDIVYHEMVHAIVLGLMRELADAGKRWRPDDLPQWLHEGLAVYVTERLKIEPGTKPVSYYRFAAPLHYLEDEWGEETLRDFIHAAITESFAAAMRLIPMDEDRLLALADAHMRRPPPVGTVARSLGYVLAFLLALVLLALAPAALAWVWAAGRRAVLGPGPDEVEALWLGAWYGSGDEARISARQFCRAFRRLPPKAREKFAWRRCKIYLVLGE